MAKIIVKANEDFYDRANGTARKKGDEFVLRQEHAESLGKLVTINKNQAAAPTAPKEPKAPKAPKAPGDMTTKTSVKKAAKAK